MLKEIRWNWGEMIFPYPRNYSRKLPIFPLKESAEATTLPVLSPFSRAE